MRSFVTSLTKKGKSNRAITQTKTREERKTQPVFSREKTIYELMARKVVLHPSLIEELGEKFRFHPQIKGNPFEVYDAFNDEALKTVYECFVDHMLDRRGRFLEYRFAQWLAGRNKAIKKIDIDKKMPFGEIDVVGYDKDGRIICIAECKAGKEKASKEDVDPWLRNVELVFSKTNGSLESAYFVNVAGFTEGTRKRMLESGKIDQKGFLSLGFGLDLSADWLVRRKRVNIFLCEERSGQIQQIFP